MCIIIDTVEKGINAAADFMELARRISIIEAREKRIISEMTGNNPFGT